jgi:hypothetical protein
LQQATSDLFDTNCHDFCLLNQDSIETITSALLQDPQPLWISDVYYSYDDNTYRFNDAIQNLKITWVPRTSHVVPNFLSTRAGFGISDLEMAFQNRVVKPQLL